MFQFFTKRTYLGDLLEGLIDIHNHILPGIDDGADTIEESLAMLNSFGQLGVKEFICTPHIMSDYYPNNPATIHKASVELQQALNAQDELDVRFTPAAEHMIDEQFEQRLLSGQTMPLNKMYILIEMSYLQPSLNFEASLTDIRKNGLFPILAHPERYAYLHGSGKKYQQYRQQGVSFQLNLLSLTGVYGSAVYKQALRLMDEKYIDFLGSDIHKNKDVALLKKAKVSKKVKKQLLVLKDKTIMSFS